MDDRRLDPDQPLPGAPEPWAETDMPSLRDGPPWHMTEMIEAEPGLAVRILERLAADGSATQLAEAARAHATAGHPIAVVGCGTSEHGARAVAAILRVALGGARGAFSIQAFEASIETEAAHGPALVIGISHEGATWATIRALELARRGGATTALITVSRRSPAAALADIVLETGELDLSWCHTVGYLSPIVAATATAAALSGASIEPGAVRSLVAAGLSPGAMAATDRLAGELAGGDRVVVIGSGVDRIAARELVLKIEEGAHLPAAFRDVETLLHGHLAGMDDRTRVVAIAADPVHEEPRAKRLRQALQAVRELGIAAGAILSPGYAAAIGDELAPAGRIVLPPGSNVANPAARALLATAVPLQLLTEHMARERGINPDPIRRDDPRYLRAAQAASPTS